jgi:FtsP/CotA-like multicopper oxidase with cupredoxin domain
LTPPYRQDGVPDLSAPLMVPGDATEYDFPLAFPGTFWMHAHTLQEQRLMAAPLIIHDPADAARDEQEIVILLHDFSFKSVEEILVGLGNDSAGNKTMDMGHMAGMGQMPGMGHMPSMDHMSGAMGHDGMKMTGGAMDLNDIEFDAFLANDRTLADPEVVRVEPGAHVRIRLINGATASNFTIDLGQLRGTLVAVDGHPIQPLTGSTFPAASAQRLDIRITLPRERAAWPILALLEGSRRRTGVVLAPSGTSIAKLAERGTREVPALDLAFERSLRAESPLAAKQADRVHVIELTGSMAPYRWGLNGKPHGEAPPYPVAAGERVELRFVNRTMMAHPMHLHGHAFQVVEIDGKRLAGAVRDTVLVPPMARVTVAFDAANPGRWPVHCHNLYHMASGMMGELRYDGIA